MADDAAAPSKPETKKKGRGFAIAVIAAIMIGEGVGIFFLVKALSPQPLPAMAGAGEGAAEGDPLESDELAEVELAECRPSNNMSGKFVVFHIRVSALVGAEDAERVTEMARAKRARLEYAVNVVVRSAEPSQLNEPGLETLQRRLKLEVDRIFGDQKLIKQVLIPQMLQSGPGV
jgi:hypothetical protein